MNIKPFCERCGAVLLLLVFLSGEAIPKYFCDTCKEIKQPHVSENNSRTATLFVSTAASAVMISGTTVSVGVLEKDSPMRRPQ